MSNLIRRLGLWPYLLFGISLFYLGLLSLNQIVNTMWPINVTRIDLLGDIAHDRADAAALLEAVNSEILLVFLAAILVTVTGLLLPLVFYLNRRFRQQRNPPGFLLVLRQSMWVGVWVAFCIWLQMNRTLGLAVAALVAIVLILFELLLQVRTRAGHVTTQTLS